MNKIEIPKLTTPLESVICYSGAFSEEELKIITDYCDKLQFMQAKVGSNSGGNVDENVRSSNVAWLEPNQEIEWLFRKICEITAIVNNDKFQFDLTNLDAIQYTTYTENEYYKWHIDADLLDTNFDKGHRKIGFSLLLADPETDFKGGEFEVIPGGTPSATTKHYPKKGDILGFPSFIPHQVAKVTSGKRKSLVWWVLGPKFK
jgi:PKHD-type hydroxylase